MATAAPSCADEDFSRFSVVRFIKENNSLNDEEIGKLCSDWTNLLENLRIKSPIRKHTDEWFVKVYSKREEMHRMETDQLHSLMNDTEALMYTEFKELIEAKLSKDDSCLSKMDKWELRTALTEIEQTFTGPEWVKNAIECMEAESKMIQTYSVVSVTPSNEQDQKIEEQIVQCETLCKEFEILYKCCYQELQALCKTSSELNSQNQMINVLIWPASRKKGLSDIINSVAPDKHLQGLTAVLGNGKTLNGFNMDMKTQIETEVVKKSQNVSKQLLELMEKLTHTVEGFRVLTAMVTQEIKEWQRHFQFNHAQIYAKPDLERIVPWCNRTGQLLDTLWTLFRNTKNLYKNVGWEWNDQGQQNETEFIQILQAFFQSSFVVVEQDDFVIKKEKKNFPKVSVRLLAAEWLSLAGCKVHAHFVYEDHLQLAADGVDLAFLKEHEREITGESVTLTGKGNNKATFSRMSLKEKKFNREDPANQMVYYEKYRLVFITEFKGKQYWTLSLPLVVTTGANQNCRALASIMWQCFSTNVYEVPVEKKEELPMCEVAKMITQKMLRLSPNRHLTEENLAHLKTRLFGRTGVSDEEMVTLKRFCFDKMVKEERDDSLCGFSFWQWFLANYNLVETHLKDYWDKGLIEGFISKYDCEQKLMSCMFPKNGLFILRFSDQHITDSQGVTKMFGHLTSVVCYNTSMKNGEKKRKVDFLEVADHKKLEEKKKLANILANSRDKHHRQIYRYLYPSLVSREDAFDCECQPEATRDGYEASHDTFTYELEQTMGSLSLSAGKHRSPLADTSSDDTSRASADSKGHGGKRLRSIEENHLTISHMLSHPSGNSPASVVSAPHMSTPEPSPAFSVQSPATEVRVTSMNDVPLLTGTPGSSPTQAEQSLTELGAEFWNNIPKTVEDFTRDEPSTSQVMSQNMNVVPHTASQVDQVECSAQNASSVPNGHSTLQVDHVDLDCNQEMVAVSELDEQVQQQLPACSQSANQMLAGQDTAVTANQMLAGQDTTVAANQMLAGQDTTVAANQMLTVQDLAVAANQIVPGQDTTVAANEMFADANQIIDLMTFLKNCSDLSQVEQLIKDMPPVTSEPVIQALLQIMKPRGDVGSIGLVQNIDSTMFDEFQQMDSGSIDLSMFDLEGLDSTTDLNKDL